MVFVFISKFHILWGLGMSRFTCLSTVPLAIPYTATTTFLCTASRMSYAPRICLKFAHWERAS
ncbi:hypothetical protein L873DRAFT_1800825 [Choiromyces venosus 120613-1]|uniref:Uncharacterized protein n=1 Tax=Choiromyces venosus 120613-1 TaxID=1336337 RepID=A0A3N4JY32_9PEZI|nr:hypothetical protein L873DRAFT_1800825 [Choiromyces venosus 120613-1]